MKHQPLVDLRFAYQSHNLRYKWTELKLRKPASNTLKSHNNVTVDPNNLHVCSYAMWHIFIFFISSMLEPIPYRNAE